MTIARNFAVDFFVSWCKSRYLPRWAIYRYVRDGSDENGD